LASYNIHLSQALIFLGLFPLTLALSFIRTLKRLAIASLIANLLQVVGLILIVEYLTRDIQHVSIRHRAAFSPMDEMALGFGSIMFAFEGISVVLPIYNQLKKREQFGSYFGIANVAFFIILMLYILVGFLGFLKYGPDVKDSITLNLPAEPLYDAVRAMFTLSILMSYPLQFYVPNEIIWEWSKKNIMRSPATWHLKDIDIDSDRDVAIVKTLDIVVAPSKGSKVIDNKQNSKPAVTTLNAANLANENMTFQGLTTNPHKGTNEIIVKPFHAPQKDGESSNGSKIILVNDGASSSSASSETSLENDADIPLKYEYLCRFLIVVMTFTLAICIPKLNLLMGLIGSFSGTILCLTIPAIIHMAFYWDTLRGFKKSLVIIIDTTIVIGSLIAGLGGSYTSLLAIVGGDQHLRS
jgi:amino acid permease